MWRIDDEGSQAYLSSLCQGMQLSHVETRPEGLPSSVCPAYGELWYYSVKKIIRRLALSSEDVFLDLGSGLGKCALQIFMQSNAQKVIGIEAVKQSHQWALLLKERCQAKCPFFWEEGRSLVFYEGNFLDYSWQEATVVYTCSTCYTSELLCAIGNKINQETQIQQVLSLRPLPTLSRLRMYQVFPVECSWDSALCFHYRCL